MINDIFFGLILAALIYIIIAGEVLHYRTFNSMNKGLFNEFKRMNKTLDKEIEKIEEQIKKKQ
jgi:hypothetical protein